MGYINHNSGSSSFTQPNMLLASPFFPARPRFGAGQALRAADGLGIRAGTGKLSAGCEESATARGFSAIVEWWGQNGVNYSENKWDHVHHP
jgi:hypothetical protein